MVFALALIEAFLLLSMALFDILPVFPSILLLSPLLPLAPSPTPSHTYSLTASLALSSLPLLFLSPRLPLSFPSLLLPLQAPHALNGIATVQIHIPARTPTV